MFEMISFSIVFASLRANGVRYPRVGGTRRRHFAGTNSKPRKLPENAATPTRRVHAVLGGRYVLICPFGISFTDRLSKPSQCHGPIQAAFDRHTSPARDTAD